jgi:hypothetical protein
VLCVLTGKPGTPEFKTLIVFAVLTNKQNLKMPHVIIQVTREGVATDHRIKYGYEEFSC